MLDDTRFVVPICCGLALGASCASPLLEDPPSKINQTAQSEAGSMSSAGSDSTGATSTTGATSSTGGVSGSTSGGNDTGVSGGGTSGTSTSGSPNTSGGGSTNMGSAGEPASGGSAGEGGVSGSDSGGTSSGGSDATGAAGVPEPSGPFETLVFQDDFEDDTEGGGAAQWTPTESASNWTVLADGGNQYYAPTEDSGDRNLTYAGSDWTDMTLQVDVRTSDQTDSGTRFYVGVRATLDNAKLNYYFVRFEVDENGKFGYYVGDSTTEVADADPPELQEDVWHTVRLTVEGSTLTAEINDELIGTATASGISAGGIALGVDGGTAEFDNVYVWVP